MSEKVSAKTVFEWLQAHPSGDVDVPLDRALWWVAYRNAEALMDSTTKDLARTLLEGTKKLDSIADVEEFVASFYDSEDQQQEDTDRLMANLTDFFGA